MLHSPVSLTNNLWHLNQFCWVCFLLFFYLGFMACQDIFTHFEPSLLLGGAKMGDPQEKTPDHQQAELGLSHMFPKLGSNQQQWDDEWFRALKISYLNHWATGAVFCCFRTLYFLCIFKGFPSTDYLSLITRKPVFRVCVQVRLKLACSATEAS